MKLFRCTKHIKQTPEMRSASLSADEWTALPSIVLEAESEDALVEFFTSQEPREYGMEWTLDIEEVSEPTPVRTRSGCKVCWKTYATEQEAQIAKVVASRLAKEAERAGYDFGFQSPGTITPVKWATIDLPQIFWCFVGLGQVPAEKTFPAGTEVRIHGFAITNPVGESRWNASLPDAAVTRHEGFDVCFP